MDLTRNIPWVEKYRPLSIGDVAGQNEIVKVLSKCLEKNGNIPHMLFFGSAGTGKTSTALALSYQLFGKKYFSERVLELNASDERGIKIVRGKIKNFAKKKIKKVRDSKYKHLCPDYKIIILDEADALTNDSQFALRRIIEEYSISTRFILICNFISKINLALISRCTKYRFKKLNRMIIYSCLKEISAKENYKISKDNLNKIIKYSDGDLRKSIITLQRLSFISNNTDNNEIINNLTIVIDKYKFDYLSNCLKENNSIENIKLISSYFIDNAYNCQSILYELSKNIVSSSLNNLQKSLLFLKLSDLDYYINNGSDDELILINFFTYYSKILIEYSICNTK